MFSTVIGSRQMLSLVCSIDLVSVPWPFAPLNPLDSIPEDGGQELSSVDEEHGGSGGQANLSKHEHQDYCRLQL